MTEEEVWKIREWIVKQEGNQEFIDKINKLFDEIIGQHPLAKKYPFTENDLWNIIIWIEMQGGNRIYVHKINEMIDEIVERHFK